ncbi:MAG TPA: universal stress protein [Streptosporangiaceae bacterium]|nr:universal stress protein [Streptosporangiaceae bacterium]
MSEPRPVLVGYDGSPASKGALRWAVEEAELRGLPLTICHAWHWPYPFRPPDPSTFDSVWGMAAGVVDDGVRYARELSDGLVVRRRLLKGAAPAMLLEAARGASVVVIGSRGHGGFEGLSVGSTAVQVPAHATCPVVVVRRTPAVSGRDGAPIVVGVDGSPASEAALAFAFEAALRRECPLRAVCSWWDAGVLPGPDRVPFTDFDVVQRHARSRFERAVETWRAEHPKVPVEARFVVEVPRSALLRAAADALLLVLGDRGIGSVPEMLLGPVTQAALHEAPCPVAVVPAPVPQQVEDVQEVTR